MKTSTQKNLEKQGLRIVKLFQQNGFKAFWVGGVVRNNILGRSNDNIDIATSASPEQTETILNSAGFIYKPVGKEYGTILTITKFGPIEITSFRKDNLYLNRRKPKSVTYISDYVEDSQRRDFTINAFYLNPITNELLDPQSGLKDLDRKLIKFVGDPRKRIDEDALRMLRAVRIATQLNFKIEKNSFAAIKIRAKYIQKISGERIKAELDKILSLPNKEEGIRLLDELSLLQFIMPEVTALKTMFHKSKFYHLEGSVFEHTMLALKNSISKPIFAYAALYHDTGKSTTALPKLKKEGWVNSFPRHEFISTDLFLQLAKRLKFSREDRNIIAWVIKMHMLRRHITKDMREDKKIALASHKYFPYLIELWKADALSNIVDVNHVTKPAMPTEYEFGLKLRKKIKSKKKLIEKLVDGDLIMKVLNISPGQRVGEIKNTIRREIISGKIKNSTDVKNFLKKIQKKA